ncbi:MAG: hypothetical protein ACPHNZ_09020 [Ilumatobacteraceae bacterium]
MTLALQLHNINNITFHDHHRAARERDRDTGLEEQALGIHGGEREGDERVVTVLPADHAVVAVLFDSSDPLRYRSKILVGESGQEAHGLSRLLRAVDIDC